MKLSKRIIDGDRDITIDDMIHLSDIVRDHYKNYENIVFQDTHKIFFIGDLHGDVGCLRNIIDIISKCDDYNVIFLGDYVDRGHYNVMTMVLLLALKVERENVILLRGNHESSEMTTKYDFRNECEKWYSPKMYHTFIDMFTTLPIAWIGNDILFACHGGIPNNVTEINHIMKENRFHPDFLSPIIKQMMWNDPANDDFYFEPSLRGDGIYDFGSKAFNEFMDNIGLDVFFRAHEAFPEGIRKGFGGRLYSIFSTSYRGNISPKILKLTHGEMDIIDI